MGEQTASVLPQPLPCLASQLIAVCFLPVILILTERVIVGIVSSRLGNARMRRSTPILRIKAILEQENQGWPRSAHPFPCQ